MAESHIQQTSGADRNGQGNIRRHEPRSATNSQRIAPPTFIRATDLDGHRLTTDPESPDYDPSALMFVNKTPAAELFRLESRKLEWAPEMERRIERTLRADFSAVLPDRALPMRVECRTSSCLVEIDASVGLSDAESTILEIIPQWAGLGSAVQIARSRHTLSVAMTISRERRDLVEFDRTTTRSRAEKYDRMRSADYSKATEPADTALIPYFRRLTDAYSK